MGFVFVFVLGSGCVCLIGDFDFGGCSLGCLLDLIAVFLFIVFTGFVVVVYWLRLVVCWYAFDCVIVCYLLCS